MARHRRSRLHILKERLSRVGNTGNASAPNPMIETLSLSFESTGTQYQRELDSAHPGVRSVRFLINSKFN